MADIDIRVKLEMPEVKELLEEIGLAPMGTVQKAIDGALLKISEPYVPFRTGRLMGTGYDYTVLGSGEIVYEPHDPRTDYMYAGRVWYGDDMNFNKAVHPLATSRWVEKAYEAKSEEVIKAAKEALNL